MDYWVRNLVKGITIYKRDRKTGKTSSLRHPTLTTINQQLKSGVISRETAHKMAAELIAGLRPKDTPQVFHSENAQLLAKYWADVYELKENRDLDAAHCRLVRGINALGDLSLHVADRAALIKRLRNAQNRYEAAAVVNQLLKYLGRPFSLPAVKRPRVKVSYISWDDLQKTLCFIDNDMERLLYQVLFCTGARVGEAFAIERVVKDKVVYIEEQIRYSHKTDETKTGVGGIRYAPILPQGVDAVKSWISLGETRLDIRKMKHGERIRAACKKAGVKSITARDLRHCYAISLANAGAPIGYIARALGNGEGVCNQYYTGFALTEPGIEALTSLLYRDDKPH